MRSSSQNVISRDAYIFLRTEDTLYAIGQARNWSGCVMDEARRPTRRLGRLVVQHQSRSHHGQ